MSSQQRDSGGGSRGMGRGATRPPPSGIRSNAPARQYGRSRGGGSSSAAAPKKVIPIEDDSSGPPAPASRQQPPNTSWANIVKKQGQGSTQGAGDKGKIVTIVKGGQTGQGVTTSNGDSGGHYPGHASTPSAELQFGELPKDLDLAQNGDTENGELGTVHPLQQQMPMQQSQPQTQQPNSTTQQLSPPQQPIMQHQMVPPQHQPAPGMPQMYQSFLPPWQYYQTPPNQMQFYSPQQQQEYTAWYNYFRQFVPSQDYAAQWSQNAQQMGPYGYPPYPAQVQQGQQPPLQQQTPQQSTQYPFQPQTPSQSSQAYTRQSSAPTETDSTSSKGASREAGSDSKSQSQQPEKPKIIIKKPTSGAIPIVNPGTNEVVKVTPAPAPATAAKSSAPDTQESAQSLIPETEEQQAQSQDTVSQEVLSPEKQEIEVDNEPNSTEENNSNAEENKVVSKTKGIDNFSGDDAQITAENQSEEQQKDTEVVEEQEPKPVATTPTPTPTMAQVIAQIPENQQNSQLVTSPQQQASIQKTVDSGTSSVLEASAAPYTPQYLQSQPQEPIIYQKVQFNNQQYVECNGTEEEEEVEAAEPEGPYFYDRVTLLKLQFTDIEPSEELQRRLGLAEFQALVSRRSSLTSHQSSIPRVATSIARTKSGVDKWGSRQGSGRLEGTRSGGLDRWNREQLSHYSRRQSPGPIMRQSSIPNPNIHKAANAYKLGAISDDEANKQRTFQSLLNKLTPTNFDKLYQQIVAVEITSPETLKGLIHQIFDKALVETSFSELYSVLCQRLTADLPAFPEPETEDSQQAAAAGQPQKKRLINFRRLLLNKCQEEFEKGQQAMQNKESDSDKPRAEETKLEEAKRKADELKDRRRALGNMQFIGYLFSKGMLTEQILHDCIQLLLKEMQNPKGEDLEQLSKLLFTVGALLDSPKARMRENMGVYMKRIMSLTNNPQLDSRIKFMLIEVVETRQRGWEARRKVEGPKTIKEIHKDAAADMKRTSSQKDLPTARKYKSQEAPVIVTKARIPPKQISPDEFRPVDPRNAVKSATLPVTKPPSSVKPPTQPQGVWSTVGRSLKSINSQEQIQQSSEDEKQSEKDSSSELATKPTNSIIDQLRDFAEYDKVQNEIKMLLEEFQINLEHNLDNPEAIEDALQKFASALEQLHQLFQQNSIPKTNTFHWVLEIALGKRHFSQYLWIIVRYFTNDSSQLQKLSGDIESSIKLALHCAYKYCEDNPFYSTMLGFVLSKFVENGVLDFRKISEFIMQAGDKEREEDPPPLVDEGGAIPIVCETLKGLIKIMGIDETQEMWRNSGFQIEQFAPEGDDFMIKTTIKQCDLDALFPSYA